VHVSYDLNRCVLSDINATSCLYMAIDPRHSLSRYVRFQYRCCRCNCWWNRVALHMLLAFLMPLLVLQLCGASNRATSIDMLFIRIVYERCQIYVVICPAPHCTACDSLKPVLCKVFQDLPAIRIPNVSLYHCIVVNQPHLDTFSVHES
jgi:hypothetical protein